MIESSPDELDADNLTVFDSKNIPPISIQDYLLRIMTYSRATSRNMVMSLSYIDILRNEKSSKFQLSRFNVHRLLVTSLMVASKFYEDLYIDNDSWATIAGVNLQELNRLERHFLAYIDFEINTKHDCFMNYVQLLLSYAMDNGIVEGDTARGILQSITDASVLEF